MVATRLPAASMTQHYASGDGPAPAAAAAAAAAAAMNDSSATAVHDSSAAADADESCSCGRAMLSYLCSPDATVQHGLAARHDSSFETNLAVGLASPAPRYAQELAAVVLDCLVVRAAYEIEIGVRLSHSPPGSAPSPSAADEGPAAYDSSGAGLFERLVGIMGRIVAAYPRVALVFHGTAHTAEPYGPALDRHRVLGYGTFRLNFHRFDRFELDLRGCTQP